VKIRAWLRLHIVARLKRAHWLFQLPDFANMRLQMQDGQRRDLDAHAKAIARLNQIAVDLSERLLHHETGPLKASKVELDMRRKDGVLAQSQRVMDGVTAPVGNRRGQVRRGKPRNGRKRS
jgi:hypothetical protein